MSTIEGAILGVIFAVIIGLGLTIFVQHHRLMAYQAQYESLTKDNAALLAENNNWKIFADNQNKKIVELATSSAARNKAAARAEIRAKKNADRYKELAATIENLKITSDDCASADAIKDVYLRLAK